MAGHGVATGIAIVGGSVLSKYLDEKIVQYVGGSLFLVSPDTRYLHDWVWCKQDAAVASAGAACFTQLPLASGKSVKLSGLLLRAYGRDGKCTAVLCAGICSGYHV